jgi:predicted hotdog family 3-hydroxylacyl-ACP dehydratase
MCLLDGVLDWNVSEVRCVSRTHRDPHNPLRARGQLSAVCGIEFAAQAMAVHGALLAQATAATPAVGYLAAVRGVELSVARLDDIEDELIARAERLGGDEVTLLYRFELTAGGRTLLAGRSTIVINPALAASLSRVS